MSTVIACDKGGGRILARRTGSVAPLTITFNGSGLISYGLVLSFDMEQRVAAQFQNAFNDAIFVTPFGDLAGDATITFLMNKECSGTGAVDKLGLIGKYLTSRLRPFGSSSINPLRIAVGSYAFSAYIVGLKMTAESRDIPVIQGTLILKAWPT